MARSPSTATAAAAARARQDVVRLCHQRLAAIQLLGGVGVGLSEVRRMHVEGYARQLEHAGRSRATVARRLATLASFYRYAIQQGALPHSPVTHVRRPAVARDSQTLGLDRQEAVRFLAAAEATSQETTPLPACSP